MSRLTTRISIESCCWKTAWSIYIYTWSRIGALLDPPLSAKIMISKWIPDASVVCSVDESKPFKIALRRNNTNISRHLITLSFSECGQLIGPDRLMHLPEWYSYRNRTRDQISVKSSRRGPLDFDQPRTLKKFPSLDSYYDHRRIRSRQPPKGCNDNVKNLSTADSKRKKRVETYLGMYSYKACENFSCINLGLIMSKCGRTMWKCRELGPISFGWSNTGTGQPL